MFNLNLFFVRFQLQLLYHRYNLFMTINCLQRNESVFIYFIQF